MTAVHDESVATTSAEADERAADGLINHRDTDIELIPPDSLTAQLVGLYTFLPINGAAFVMQVMHPVIGDVVDKFSVFRKDPVGRAIRSADSVLRWTYGGQEAIEEGKRLRRLHQPLQMRNAEGKHISALNPEAYAWVIATAFPTMTTAAPLMLGREFSEEERKELLRDNRRIAKILQVPMHGDLEDLRDTPVVAEQLLAFLLGELAAQHQGCRRGHRRERGRDDPCIGLGVESADVLALGISHLERLVQPAQTLALFDGLLAAVGPAQDGVGRADCASDRILAEDRELVDDVADDRMHHLHHERSAVDRQERIKPHELGGQRVRRDQLDVGVAMVDQPIRSPLVGLGRRSGDGLVVYRGHDTPISTEAAFDNIRSQISAADVERTDSACGPATHPATYEGSGRSDDDGSGSERTLANGEDAGALLASGADLTDI